VKQSRLKKKEVNFYLGLILKNKNGPRYKGHQYNLTFLYVDVLVRVYQIFLMMDSIYVQRDTMTLMIQFEILNLNMMAKKKRNDVK